MKHAQCLLQKDNKSQVVWIPEKYAKFGKVLRIGKQSGWVVTEIFEKDDSKLIYLFGNAYRHQRSVSDI